MRPGKTDHMWTRLLVTVPLTDDQVRAALTALAGLAGQPRVVLEARGAGGRVSWRLGCRRNDTSRIVGALGAHLPSLRSEEQASTFDGLSQRSVAASLRFVGDGAVPLKTDSSAPVVRGLLAALTRAQGLESVDIQLILGPRRRPNRVGAGTPPGELHVRRRKAAEHSFGCSVRVAATADVPRARSLINGVVAALRGLETPGLRLHLRSASIRAFDEARSPFLWPSRLSVSDLVPLTAYPIGELPLPGVPSPHPLLLPATAQHPMRGRRLGTATASATERDIAITEGDSLRHLHLISPTGTGKSTVLANLAIQDMERGKGVVVVDPKGDLIEELLARIPTSRIDDVVVLDPLDDAPVGLNGLRGGPDAERAADVLLGTFHALYADSWGPRTQDILAASLLTLARRGDASLALIPLLLTNPGFRRSVVGSIVKQDPMGLGSFWAWFDSISEAERQTVIAPLMNKLRPLLLRPGIRGIFGQRHARFDVADIFSRQRILLVSLSRGRLGPEAAQLLGALTISLVWDAATARAATTAKRSPVSIFIDEIQEYLRLPGDLGDALATGRSSGLQLHLAHQSMSQLPNSLREAVLANARSRLMFQLSTRDARDLAATSRGQVTADDLQSLPVFQAYAALLVGGSPAPWVSVTTRPLPPPVSDPTDIRARSRRQYGQPLSDIEADLLSLSAGDRAEDERLGRTPRQGGAR